MSVVSPAKPATEAAPAAQAASQAPAAAATPAAPPKPRQADSQPPQAKRTAAELAREIRRARARSLLIALLVWTGIPTLLGAVYYGAIARNQFESNATLVMRGNDAVANQRLVLLHEYLQSRDLLSELEKRLKFSEHYQHAGDPIAGLRAGAGSEQRYEAFRDHVDVRYDSHTHVLNLRVHAYSAERAQVFAREMLTLASSFLTGVEGADATMVQVAQPSRPTESTHPRRAHGILTVFFVSLAFFGIGSLLIAAVREHAQF
jgi:capsular polysaccharide transport system permease protein